VKHQGSQLMRQREDHMHIGNRQQFRIAGSQPLVSSKLRIPTM
jgi:hypothetical protein